MKFKDSQELDTRLLLCVNCYNCKTRKGKVYCIKGCFDDMDMDKPIIYTPLDFECYFFELVYNI
jgi:hypothetical protein